jgi:hypothetical protein
MVQHAGEGLLNWEDVVPQGEWNWSFDGEKIILNELSLGRVVFALLKVRR